MFTAWGAAGATLPDGKLLQELALAALSLLPGDPLLPARLLSVACGLGVVLTMVAMGRDLGQPRAGALAALLYVFTPLASIHDVLALPDSMLALVGSLLLWASLRYGRNPQVGRRDALLIGGLLAMAILVKLTGLFLFALPVLAALLLPKQWAERRRKLASLRLALIVVLVVVAVLVPLQYGRAEWQKLGGAESRIALIIRNTLLVGDWLVRYLPGVTLLPAFAVLFRSRKRHAPDDPTRRLTAEVGVCLAAAAAVSVAFIVLGSTLYPRYLLGIWPALLYAAALSAVMLWPAGRNGRRLVAVSVGGALLWGAGFSATFAFAPEQAPLAQIDRTQYLEAWTAGHRIDKVLSEIQTLAATNGELIVVNHNQPRLVNMATAIYLDAHPAIELATLDLTQPTLAETLAALQLRKPTVVLVDAQVAAAYRIIERAPSLTPLAEWYQPNGATAVLMFQVADPEPE